MSGLRALVLTVLLAAAPSVPAAAADPVAYDPWESYNRSVFAFNNGLSSGFLEPLRQAYVANVSAGTRSGLANVFGNLREPWTAVSSALRGDLPNARTSLGRFLINTTAGIAGWYDVAADRYRMVSQYDDLGRVLCSYGMRPGPYIVLPFLGPMTARDLVGRTATMVGTYYALGMDTYILYRSSDGMVRYLEDGFIDRMSKDPTVDVYALERNLYAQARERQCAGTQLPRTSPYGLDQQ